MESPVPPGRLVASSAREEHPYDNAKNDDGEADHDNEFGESEASQAPFHRITVPMGTAARKMSACARSSGTASTLLLKRGTFNPRGS